MKASEKAFLKFLQGTNQFVVPIYQRTYSWTIEECAQLWDDIVRTAKEKKPGGHFVGSIVYIEKGIFQVSTVPELLVIDGQQRLATLSLLIAALARAAKAAGDSSDMSYKKLMNYYLLNSEESGKERYKLVLTQADRDTLTSLVDEGDLPKMASRRLVRNFDYFTEKIKQVDLTSDQLFEGLSRLIIVDISLDRTHDNPQLIFESLNSTGLELTQADLIRNFVLMGLEPADQESLYSKYWFPMEQEFGDEGYTLYFDRFMRDFLTLRTGRIPNIDRVYVAFKEYAHASGLSIPALVSEISRHAQYFVSLALEREPDPEIRATIRDINTLRVDVAYPFFLHLYELREQGHLESQELLGILRVVESYVFRRLVCGVPTNTLNKTFAALSGQLVSSSPLESLEAAFMLKDSYRRFPDDEEFGAAFAAKDVYNLRSRNYLLRKLENHGRKEHVEVETYTIEHVLPQNADLSSAWQEDLGPDWKDVQARLLHTIGNLTLTGYNSELSDRSFKEKRDMAGGFRDSPIRMNRDLARLETWNETEIKKRAARLAKKALEIWRAPHLAPEVVDLYRPAPPSDAQVYHLSDHPHLQGSTLALFSELEKRVLNIDSAVREEILKRYIAFKDTTNFVDVIPQSGRLKLSLNLRMDELTDPKGLARDVAGLGHWGNGDVELTVSSPDQLDHAMYLVHQAYDRQSESSEV